jgi:hypothetical protein
MRTIMIAVLSVFFSTVSFSQESKFSISVNSLTTNFNYGKQNSALRSYKTNYKGLQAGIAYQAGITSRFSIVPELYFARKGAILDAGNPLTGSRSTWKLYSIEMLVLARFHFHRVYVNAGPYIDYTLSGRLKTKGSPTAPGTNGKLSFGNGASAFRRWDLGAMAGAGYNFSLGKTDFTLDARYGYGITKISSDLARYNRVLNISLVVSRPKKKKQSE